jgi:hypothetical protein
LLARGKAWKALAVQTELFEPSPPVRHVNLDKIEGVIRDKDGAPVVIATRGGRQYRISLPESVALELAAKLRELD